MNRLASATSPYLLQHADNPVDWWPWSDDAFAEARRRDVPVLISVGYSSCHWCHVMAHESFEDEGVADIVNAGFVAIKVDREERPDVDAVYMTATQAMSGQGGWPMTVFATPSGEPFFAGTYFPRPNFLQLLDAVSAAWRDQREAVLKQSTSVVESISRSQRLAAGPGSVTPEQLATALDQAAAKLGRDFDERYGGFGGAPKFPPHLAMLFLARYHGRTGDERALEMARATAEQMARGGIYDQLAGGFARYAVDGTWTVPHFEKMLYDNALLLRVYTELWRETGDPMCGRVARETAAFLVAGLGTPEGGFASALDADTAGVEGLTYVWTPEQLSDALGADDGGWAADLFGVTAAGTFEHGTSVLRLARDIDGLIDADAEGRGTGNTVRRWDSVRERLMAVRAERPQPARDDKVVAEWNGLAITGLTRFAAVARAVASTVSGALVASGPTTGVAALGAEADAALAAAVAAGEVLVRVHIVDGRLRRVSRDGAVGAPAGVLADYGAVAHAFCALYQATTDPRWLTSAGSLLDHALARFPDGTGGFFDTADDAEALVTRPADPTDNATPSGTSSMIEALITYTALTGETRYREAADAALAAMIPVITEHPRFAGMAAADAEQALSGPLEIAITGPDETGRSALVTAAVMRAAGGTVIVSGAPDEPGHPLLTSRPAIGGAPAAYICRGFVCERPVTTVAELTAQLARR